ncbi:MAG: DnaJ domain-containing protein, partial [Alphaproteobacteria bacterium]|nr:DnaJ domain-containing protein [Alphaproteobacteria bacterium]
MTADALGYYNILQVAEDADAEQIKLSYRELAKKWHPDYNQDNRATDVFQEISAAYEVLSNPQKRLEYDILSLVYDKKNYPDLTAMQLIKSTGKEIDVRAVEIHENMAWGIYYKKTEKIVVSDYDTAL